MPILGAIDAGSNAVRVMIGSATGAGAFEEIAAERMPVRLGQGTFTRGALDAQTIDAARTAFGRFRKLFDQHEVTHYRAVATSALRSASNRESLLEPLSGELGIELEVIDGQEEARLVSKAVLHKLRGQECPAVIADLGGGSLEVMLRTEREPWVSSMPIGTVRMMETFGLLGALSDDEARMVRRFVASSLKGSLPRELFERGGSIALCGGNAEAFGALLGRSDGQGASKLAPAELERALPEILALDVEGRMQQYSVRQDRAEVMAVAGLVFVELARATGVECFVVPGVGIREGILLELSESVVGNLATAPELAVIAAARAFAARIGHNTTHGEHTRRICVQLFEQLQPVHQLEPHYGVVLQIAALLHDIGEVVHRKGHHRHSEYLVREGRIPGLKVDDRLIVAAVARAHRKSMPTPAKHSIYGRLDEKARQTVDRLAAILRIADAIDADHRQRVVAVAADVNSDAVAFHVSVQCGGAEISPDLRKAEAFERLFDRRVSFACTEVSPNLKMRALQVE